VIARAARIAAAITCALAAICNPASATETSAEQNTQRVRHDYLLSCAGCHRFDGSGSGRVPALYDTARILTLPGGREYLASVPGVAQAPLGDERLAALLNWVLVEFGGADEIVPYRAAEISSLRSHPLRAPREARARITHTTTPAQPSR
jgi:mono/diheme cytochrome c family protein